MQSSPHAPAEPDHVGLRTAESHKTKLAIRKGCSLSLCLSGGNCTTRRPASAQQTHRSSHPPSFLISVRQGDEPPLRRGTFSSRRAVTMRCLRLHRLAPASLLPLRRRRRRQRPGGPEADPTPLRQLARQPKREDHNRRRIDPQQSPHPHATAARRCSTGAAALNCYVVCVATDRR
jgi:hypothetical protein